MGSEMLRLWRAGARWDRQTDFLFPMLRSSQSRPDSLLVESWAESSTLFKLFSFYLFCPWIRIAKSCYLVHALNTRCTPWTRGLGFWGRKLWIRVCALIPTPWRSHRPALPQTLLFELLDTFSGPFPIEWPCDWTSADAIWMVEILATSRPGTQPSMFWPPYSFLLSVRCQWLGVPCTLYVEYGGSRGWRSQVT